MPTPLTHRAGMIAHRVCRHLTRQGWLEGEDDGAFLSDRAGSDDFGVLGGELGANSCLDLRAAEDLDP
jgi:hypothetical protein